MFYKKVSVKAQTTISRESSLRDRILSLQFYMLGFLLVMSNKNITSFEQLPKNYQNFTLSLNKSYRLTNEEIKTSHHNLMAGIDCFHKSYKVHKNGQKYIDLVEFKDSLKDYKLSFRGDNCTKELKMVLMYLLDFIFVKSQPINEKILNQDMELPIKSEYQQFIKACIRSLGFSHVVYNQLLSIRMSPTQKKMLTEKSSHLYPEEYVLACTVLNVKENAEMSNIRRKFNSLMRDHHPDKLASKNLSDAQIKHHSEMTHRYHSAFQTVKQYRKV